jgi:hypothetical protein
MARRKRCFGQNCGEMTSEAVTCPVCRKPVCPDCYTNHGACNDCITELVSDAQSKSKSKYNKGLPAKIKKLQTAVAKAVTLKAQIGDKRDEMRKLATELDEICYSFERGDESFSAALHHLEEGIDSCSELV